MTHTTTETKNEIVVNRQPSAAELKTLGVLAWPVWAKEISKFPWTYDARETCYLLEGDVIVTPHAGTPTRIGAGDLVIFPAGMSCTWDIRKPVRKHYRFG